MILLTEEEILGVYSYSFPHTATVEFTDREIAKAQVKKAMEEVISLVVTERKIYGLLCKKHKKLKPADRQSDLFYKGYARALQVIINQLKQVLKKECDD